MAWPWSRECGSQRGPPLWEGSQREKATAKARTKGLTTVITSLAGKALEIEAAGSFDDFDWRFKNVPGLKNLENLVS